MHLPYAKRACHKANLLPARTPFPYGPSYKMQKSTGHGVKNIKSRRNTCSKIEETNASNMNTRPATVDFSFEDI